MTIRPELPATLKIAPVGKFPQSPEVERMAAKGQEMRASGENWVIICCKLKILKSNGEPDPGMAYQIIVNGYEPKRPATRVRLGLPPTCPTCYQHLPRPPRVVPPLVKQMADNLAALEAAAKSPPAKYRVYGAGSRQAVYAPISSKWWYSRGNDSAPEKL